MAVDQERVATRWAEVENRLRERADAGYPDPWLPEPGDEVFGVVEQIDPSVTTKFGPVPVVTIAKPNGERVAVWLTHTVLRRAFARQNVGYGERILIRYRGRTTSNGGGDYADYQLVVDRDPSRNVDWRAIAAQHNDDIGDVPAPDPGFAPPAADESFADFGQPPEDDIPF